MISDSGGVPKEAYWLGKKSVVVLEGLVYPILEEEKCSVRSDYDNILESLEKLEELGVLQNTIVIFTSDHGEWLGDHGLLLKGPMLYDGLLRVPLVIAGPGVPEGMISRSPVSTLDLRSTLAELCGIKANVDDGLSLVPVMSGDEERYHAYGEWKVESARSGIDLDLRTVRTKRYRISFDMLSGAGELYDFDNDPKECQDLFNDQSMSQVRKELIGIIRDRKPFNLPSTSRVGWY